MDPVTAFSTAASVIQVVDFSIRLLSSGHQLYKSSTGTLSIHDEVKYTTNELSTLSSQLTASLQQSQISRGNAQDLELQELGEKCQGIANDLMSRLQRLKVDGKNGALKSLRIALISTWAKKDLDRLVENLGSYKSFLETRYIIDLGSRVTSASEECSQRFDKVDASSENVMATLQEIQEDLTRQETSEHFTSHRFLDVVVLDDAQVLNGDAFGNDWQGKPVGASHVYNKVIIAGNAKAHNGNKYGGKDFFDD